MRKPALIAACLLCAFSAYAQTADLILLHGKILTVDANDFIAQAIAVRQGKIVAIGSDREIAALAGPKTQTIDLRGRTATPGLIDTHAHLAEGGVDELYAVSLSDATSVSDVIQRVQAAAAKLPPGQWVTGSGWDA